MQLHKKFPWILCLKRVQRVTLLKLLPYPPALNELTTAVHYKLSVNNRAKQDFSAICNFKYYLMTSPNIENGWRDWVRFASPDSNVSWANVGLMWGWHYWCWANMMTSSNGDIFRITGHLYGVFTIPRWIPHTKASDTELWCFLWSASEWMVQ